MSNECPTVENREMRKSTKCWDEVAEHGTHRHTDDDAMCNVQCEATAPPPEPIAVQQVVEEAHKDVNKHRYNVGQDDSIAETGRR